MSTIEDQIIARRERGDVTIDEIMRAVVESQDMALAWYRKEEDSYGTLNNQYLVIGELIAAALADARREGAEAMQSAAFDACVMQANADRRFAKSDRNAGAVDCATELAELIRALPLPTGERQAVLLTDERLDALADEVFDLIQDAPDDDVGDRTWDRMFGRSVQSAVLAANNLEVRRG